MHEHEQMIELVEHHSDAGWRVSPALPVFSPRRPSPEKIKVMSGVEQRRFRGRRPRRLPSVIQQAM